MTVEKILKIALQKFKDVAIDDSEEPCLVHIDNIISHKYVVVFRLTEEYFDENHPHFLVFGGSEGGLVYYDKTFTNYLEATDYFYHLIEKTI